MNTNTSETTNSNKYHVARVEEANPPEGMPEGKWYRYVIAHGKSQIEGIRAGTLKAVTKHAEEFAENLNMRGTRGYSAYTSRKTTK